MEGGRGSRGAEGKPEGEKPRKKVLNLSKWMDVERSSEASW